jgi:hypothetical protein
VIKLCEILVKKIEFSIMILWICKLMIIFLDQYVDNNIIKYYIIIIIVINIIDFIIK